MARKSTYISILQFDEHAIAWLRIDRSSEGAAVLAHEIARGDWSEEGALSAALSQFVAEHGIKEDAVYTVLPRHSITTRILDLPSDSLEEIAGMVRFSAEEYVPFSTEEILIDQCILQAMSAGMTRVLAAFAHRDVVNGHMNLMEQAGVVPERVFLSTACLATAAAAARPPEQQEFALLNMAIGGIEGIVIDDQGRLLFGRGVATARDWGIEGDAAAEAWEELAVESRATLAAYRRESVDGLGVERVFLCSDVTQPERAAEFIANETGKDCQPASFALHLVTSGAEHLKSLPLVALGAALIAQERGSVSIDLLPESVTETRQMKVARKRLLQAAGLVALILLGVAGLFYQHVYQAEQYRIELEQRLNTLAGQARGIREKREQLRILRREVRPRGSVLQYLTKVCEVAPEGDVNVLEFRMRKDDGIDLRGRAQSLDTINALGQALRELGRESALEHFLNASRKYENDNIRERDKMVWEYHYAIPFNPEEGDEVAQETE
ncbi:MAG: pilus assembly protein PilM [Candidatus Hydrogenedentota bacterium]